MKSTILSQKDATLLENLIIKYGLFVNFEQIFSELRGEKSLQETKNIVGKLHRQGWLVRIKRGIYYISNLESRGSINISPIIIAQTLVEDSYVSCEAALQHYGMFDQYLKTIISISLKRFKTKEIQDTNYEFISTNRKNYFGWKKFQIEGKEVKIAEMEKAILDIISFRRTISSIDLVLEKLRDYKNNFNLDKLKKFSENQSTTTKRILGFLMDKVGMDSNEIYMTIKKEKGSSFMDKDSQNFNAKWRLYYSDHFKQN
ncbi:hypothetical protein D4R87_03220 [bacterium]|nr:MAG: hypothetical protein D4R87_03220 [bacterium]